MKLRRGKDKARSEKRRLLKWIVLVVLALLVLCVVYCIGYIAAEFNSILPQQSPASSQNEGSTLETTEAIMIEDIDMLQLWTRTNEERQKAGLAELVLNPELNKSAKLKCDDMVSRNYWSHNTPDGVEPWNFFREVGITYTNAGENLAYGYEDANSAVAGWMDSQTHKDNILTSVYTDVGFAACKSDNFIDVGPQIIIVQHFMR